jgi:hypothetical protein
MTSTQTQREYDRLTSDLAGRGVVAGQMFGKPTLKSGTKAIACLFRDGVAFKLGAGTPEHTAALELSGANLFDPSGAGRPMKDWVCVPEAHADRWMALGEAALHKVGSA